MRDDSALRYICSWPFNHLAILAAHVWWLISNGVEIPDGGGVVQRL